MRRALELARLGEGYTRPNPLVGAVVVRDGQIVGEGYHASYGGPHAEVVALQQAGGNARGADLFTNLEPCCHWGKTPPCAEAILAAGIRRVVLAHRDPNPLVNGQGLAQLKKAGVEVIEGVLAEEGLRLNEVFLHWIRTKTPFVVLKLALSLDGKIATRERKSQWITGEESRRFVHILRRRYAAVLVGIGTVLSDDPELTVRAVAGPQPLRVVLDSAGRIPFQARVLSPAAKTLIATTARMPESVERELTARGVEVWRLPTSSGGVDLSALLAKLGGQGVDSVLVEGGSEVAWSFLSQGFVQKVAFFYAPVILGGRRAVPAVGGEGVGEPTAGFRLQDLTVERVGEDLLVLGYLNRPAAPS